MTSVFSWQNSVSLALLHFVLQGQICLLLQVSLDFYFCVPVPCNEEDIFFWELFLVGLVGPHRTVQLRLLQHYRLGHRLGLISIYALDYYSAFKKESNAATCSNMDGPKDLHLK